MSVYTARRQPMADGRECKQDGKTMACLWLCLTNTLNKIGSNATYLPNDVRTRIGEYETHRSVDGERARYPGYVKYRDRNVMLTAAVK